MLELMNAEGTLDLVGYESGIRKESAITAPLVVQAAQRILYGEVRLTGTRAPGEIFNAEEFLRALSADLHLR